MCIFCGDNNEATEYTDEHVFPDAIGGLLVLKGKVCKPCNDKLGHSVDSHLVNHGLVSFARLNYGLKGKSGKVPNPLEKGVLADDPTQKIRYEFTDDGKPKRTYLVRQISTTKQEDALEVSINIDASDRKEIPSILRKLAKRNNFSISDEQVEAALQLPSEEFQPTIRNSMMVDLEKYRKAILKIGYELGCYWLGDEYYNDPVASCLRETIFSDAPLNEVAKRLNMTGNVRLVAGKPAYPFISNNRACHIAFSMPQSDFISCYVRVFMLFEGHILLTRNPERYPAFEGKFLEIDVEKKSMRELSYLQEIGRVCLADEQGTLE